MMQAPYDAATDLTKGPTMSRLPARALLAAVIIAPLVISGCGRKSNLELAPEVKDTPQAQGQPGTLRAGTSPAKVPERKFVLDGLI